MTLRENIMKLQIDDDGHGVCTNNPIQPKTGHCKGCRWLKDINEVFRRGVSMESLCASCYVRNKYGTKAKAESEVNT